MLTGCSLIEEPGKPCDSGSDDIMLSVRMISSDVVTRADDQDHSEVNSELKAIEDGIDKNDLGIFVFAKMENSEDPEKLLLKITDIGKSNDPFMSIIGAPGAYTINMVFKREKFHEILGVEALNPASSERVLFRILVLANCTSPGTNALAKWNLLTGTTYNEVITQVNAVNWHYALSYLYNADTKATEASAIWTNRKKHIPMIGTNTFKVSQESLYNSRPEDRVFLGELDMLRALAKVRIVDNIKNKDASGYPKIISTEIAGTQDMVCQLPANAASYINGNQVHEPNIANPDNSFNSQSPISYRLGIIPASINMTPANERKGETFIGYLPEQKIDHLNNNVAEGTPQFRITVAMDEELKLREYTVPMTGYAGKKFEFGDYILRNHIYTLSVESVQTSQLILNVAVKNWRKINYEHEY